jgi:glycosyltransferase involved in cell wall biosynthesis
MSIRVLIVSPIPLDPLSSGNRVRIRAVAAALESEIGATVEIAVIQRFENPAELRVPGFSGRVWSLNCGERPSLRIAARQAIGRWVRRHAWLARLWHRHRRHVDGQSDAAPLPLRLPREALVKALRTGIERFSPTHVLFEYAYLSILCPAVPVGVARLVDTHDRLSGREKIIQRSGFTIPLYSPSEQEEANMLGAFDHIIAIQASEAAFFARLTPRPTVVLSHRVEIRPCVPPALAEPAKFVFLGSLNHVNIATVQRLLGAIWPQLRHRLPQARLVIAGEVATVVQPAEGVELLASLAEVRTLYARATALLNPIEMGTGLKIKNAEALGHGVPVITTTDGADGLEFATGQGLIVCEAADDFVEAACRLATDPTEQARVAHSAQQSVRKLNSYFTEALRSVFSPSRASE